MRQRNPKRCYLNLSLCLLFCLCFVLSGAKTVKAEELRMETAGTEGLLQAGGLLIPSEKKGSAYGLYAEYSAAEQAVMDAFDKMETTLDMKEYNIPRTDIANIVGGILNNHPRYFYVNTYRWYYSQSSENVTSLNIVYVDGASELKTVYEEKVAEILAKLDSSWTDLEKVVFLNDYIAVHCVYDMGALNSNPAPHTYDAYGALVNRLAVCQGYAEAFQDLMNRLEIPCELVTSSKLNHAWNMVQLGNQWYHLDVTWNDPVPNMTGRARHYYLLKSTDWFQDASKGKHNAEDYVFSGSGTTGSAVSTVYDEYFWNDIDTAMVYYAGKWYGLIKSSGALNQYQANAAGFTQQKNLFTISDKWSVWGGGSYWVGCFSKIALMGSKIYYSVPQAVYAYDLNTGAKTMAYECTAAEKASGYIYGIVLEDGILTYGLAQKSNEELTDYQYTLHVHSYHSEVTKEATCTEAGLEMLICAECGDKKENEIAPEGHKPGAEANCTEAQKCTACGAVLEEALGHKPGAEATCTEAQKCRVCQAVLQGALGHQPGAEATCTEAQSCTVCGAVLEEALGHKPGAEATCTEAQKCTVCQKVLQEATGHQPGAEATCTEAQKCMVCQEVLKEALGHKPGAEATCTEAQKCTVCQEVLKEALGHKPGAEATCTEAQSCTVCGAVLQEATGHQPGAEATCAAPQICTICQEVLQEPLEHSYEMVAVVEEATCQKEGTEKIACKVCGQESTRSIPKTAHQPGAEATCAAPQICTVCQEVLQEPLEHSYERVAVVEESTCQKEGKEKVSCKVCGLETTRSIPKTAHTPGAEATCTEAQKCTVCQEILQAALGHTPGAKATCTEAQKCTVCQAVLQEATGHTPGAKATCTEAQKCTVCQTVLQEATGHTPGAEATCTEAQKCTVCQAVLQAALGHTPGAKATCTEAQKCTVCQAVLQEATGHDYQLTEQVEATCAVEGVTTYTCQNCGDTRTETIAKKAHDYKDKVTQATLVKNGKIVSTCTVCGAKKKETIIYSPKSFTLSTDSYRYNGKVKTPTVKVKDSKGKTITAGNYTVSYGSGRKEVGKYNVKITFKGNYKGTKTLTFKIYPAPVNLKSLSAGSKKLVVKWNKNTKQVTGYELAYSTNKNFTAAATKTILIKKNTTDSKTISNLKAKKKYYVRIRTYKEVSKTKYYSEWSTVKSISTKK